MKPGWKDNNYKRFEVQLGHTKIGNIPPKLDQLAPICDSCLMFFIDIIDCSCHLHLCMHLSISCKSLLHCHWESVNRWLAVLQVAKHRLAS